MESSSRKVITHCMLLIASMYVHCFFVVVVLFSFLFVFYRIKLLSIMAATGNHPQMELTKITIQCSYRMFQLRLCMFV